MGHLEYRIMESFTSPVPELYKRYIDDGFGASSRPESVVLDFIYFVKNFHPSVKFTYNISPVSVEFLDIQVNIKDSKFNTSVFYKPTDAHSYLHFHSFHHLNTKASIPYPQFLRLRRLRSDDGDFLLQCCKFFSALGYPT